MYMKLHIYRVSDIYISQLHNFPIKRYKIYAHVHIDMQWTIAYLYIYMYMYMMPLVMEHIFMNKYSRNPCINSIYCMYLHTMKPDLRNHLHERPPI